MSPGDDDIPARPEGSSVESDAELLAALSRGNDWLRAVLCTAARRGVQLRTREPGRAGHLLDQLSRWPWFKGGQFLFDLMEWEDFMVDGTPPPVLAGAFGTRTWEQLARSLRGLQQTLDGDAVTADSSWGSAEQLAVQLAAGDDRLPPLEPGLCLYHDVALGLFASASQAWPPADTGAESGSAGEESAG